MHEIVRDVSTGKKERPQIRALDCWQGRSWALLNCYVRREELHILIKSQRMVLSRRSRRTWIVPPTRNGTERNKGERSGRGDPSSPSAPARESLKCQTHQGKGWGGAQGALLQVKVGALPVYKAFIYFFIKNASPQIFIDNEWLPSSRGRTFPTFNPATGVKICDVEEADRVRRQLPQPSQISTLWHGGIKYAFILNHLCDFEHN